MQGEILAYQEEQSFPKEQHVGVDQDVVACRHDASKNMESPCSWDVSHGEIKIEETVGSCGREKEHELPVFVHGSFRPGGGR